MRSESVKIASHQRNREKTRAIILATAERIFAKAGLAGARTDAIAKAAGVNKALLYYYFKSKEGLYEAVVEDHFRRFNQQALELLDSDASPSDVLLRYVSLHFDFISAHRQSAPLFQQFMMAGGKRTERLIRKYFKPRSDAVGKLLERGVRAGEFRRTDLFHTAVSIISLIVFYFSAAPVLQLLGHSDAHSAENLKLRKREVLNFIRHALFINPNAPVP
jgi:TetR/AcrR family transcriptional regulator